MEIIKFATEWAKAEVFSARFFIFFALLLLAGSAGFWQLGKTEIARSFIIPSLVTGILLLAVGVGIFFMPTNRELRLFKKPMKRMLRLSFNQRSSGPINRLENTER